MKGTDGPGAGPTAWKNLRSKAPKPVNGKTRGRRLAISVAAVAILALVADAGYSTYAIAMRLPRAANSLRAARAALSDGDSKLAEAFLAEAARDTGAAKNLAGRPGFSFLRATPDGRYIASVAEAAELATDAGTSVLSAVTSLGGNAEDIASSVFKDGRMDLESIAAAQPQISQAARGLREASAILKGANDPWLDAVADPGSAAEEEIAGAARSAAVADSLLGALGGMFGANGERTYLLGFQALGEARATGGLIGYTGTLKAKDGAIELTHVEPILRSIPSDLDEPVGAPEWFETNYGPQSALIQPRQVNTSPNFPVVAEAMLDMFESETSRKYDGMVLMDPVTLEYLLPAIEPLTIEGWDDPITAANVVHVLLRDSYTEMSKNEQNIFLARVVKRFWNRISSGDFEAVAFTDGLEAATVTQHLRVYARDDEAAAAMSDANIDGDYTRYGPNVQLAFHNNYSANKIDYFLRRDIVTNITLDRNVAVVNSRITMSNTAPDGPPSKLLGPSGGYTSRDAPGMNRMLFNVLLPTSIDDIVFGTGKRAADAVAYRDDGHPVAWRVMEIPAGETVTVRLSYEILNPYEAGQDGVHFRFTQYPQPAVTPDRFSVTVIPPEGYGLVATNTDLDVGTTKRHSLEGSLAKPTTVDVVLTQIPART